MHIVRPLSLGVLGAVLAASTLVSPTSAVADDEVATATITGTVLNETTGTPIPQSVYVQAYERLPGNDLPQPVGDRAPVDAGGHYALTGLESGKPVLVRFVSDVEEHTGNPSRYKSSGLWASEWYNDTRDKNAAVPVAPIAGAPLVIDAGLARYQPIVATSKPRIVGTRRVGKTLKAKNVRFNVPGVRIEYRWYVGGSYVGGTRGSLPRLKLKAQDAGKRVRVVVEASKTLHFDTEVKSARTGKVMKAKKSRTRK